ncbi:SDR family oxidoreductase [candidate division KSB1 bacterium]|nr:SDR family oxidoreductase [candidate division KSB1 bacterium]
MHVKQLLSLENKIILVTGGAGRYGKPIVEGLAEAGGTVITASRNLAAGQTLTEVFREKGLDVHALQVDQAEHQSVLALKEQLKAQFGGLDVFVNNAVARPMKSYNAPLEDWIESMRINATGMFDITREMADLIAGGGGGTIINIASMMGMFGPDLSNYEGTDMGEPPPDYFFHKGGMITLTRYLARVLAAKHIRINCISPGGLLSDTPLPARFLENYNKKVPLGRMATHDDIKGLVVFLASDASVYINGENILMDGGMHA